MTGETWRDVLGRAGAALTAPGEAWFILEEASGYDRAQLVGHLAAVAPARAVAHVDEMVARRVAGEPLQYVIGQWGFRRLDLLVDQQ